MKIYLVHYDNGGEYEDNENYIDAIFDAYEKAVNYCVERNYIKSGEGNYFTPKNPKWPFEDQSFEIIESEMNKRVNYNG